MHWTNINLTTSSPPCGNMSFCVERYLVYRIQAYNHKPQRNRKKPFFGIHPYLRCISL